MPREFDTTPKKGKVRAHKRRTKSKTVLVREHLRQYFGENNWMGWTTSSNEKGIWIDRTFIDGKPGGKLFMVAPEDGVSVIEGYVQDDMAQHGTVKVKVYESDDTHCTVKATFKPRGYKQGETLEWNDHDFADVLRYHIVFNYGVEARVVEESWSWDGYTVKMRFHNRWGGDW